MLVCLKTPTPVHRGTPNCLAGLFDSGLAYQVCSPAIVTISVFGILPLGIALLRT